MTATMQTTSSPRERELRGRDNRRYELPMSDELSTGPNPSGLCMCGCGQRTRLAVASHAARGHVKGQPIMYVHGHHARGATHSADRRAKGSAAKMGERNPRWRGGRTEDSGYVRVKVGRDHPMADHQGYAKEHRLVVAAALGRFLAPSEHVHHIDLDTSNNVPENLVVVSRSQHMAIHRRIECGQDPANAVQEVLG